MDKQAASPSLARLAAAYRYLYYSDHIEGWMFQTTALAMMELIWLQEEAGFAGNLAEIGVHHGCSALALIAAARPDETLIAIDLFDRQDLNIDASGAEGLAAFQGHLQYLFPQAQVRTIAKSSLEIRGAEKENGLAGLRFFSVDGGHTIALTLNDLEIADASLAPHGIAVLDDVFNTDWPGVVSGLFAFLARGAGLVRGSDRSQQDLPVPAAAGGFLSEGLPRCPWVCARQGGHGTQRASGRRVRRPLAEPDFPASPIRRLPGWPKPACARSMPAVSRSNGT